MLRLVARCGDQICSFSVPGTEAVIGSDPGNDLVLPFQGVSRRHARVRPAGREVLFIDLGSKNGIVLAGERLPQALLSPGGEVQLGRASLTLEEVPSSEAEMAISLACRDPLENGPLFSSTSTVLLGPARRSARAALRWIRDVERAGGTLRPADPRLTAARLILGAETLLAVQVVGDDIAVVACHGRMPSEPLTHTLAQLAPGDCRQLDEGDGTRTVLLGGSGRPGALRLAAVLSPEHPNPSAWERDFFDHLAHRLGPAEPGDDSVRPEPEPALRLPEEMVPGESPAALALLADLRAAARCQLDVLLLGETGTGKELLARAIHASGPTAKGPFIAINCAAIPGDLLEAELFGVQGRVATGVDPRPGHFARAHGGTLLLDEIGELAEGLQAKLLRVLQEREILPLGASAPRKIDVRIVSASNRDLAGLAAAGRFRADLYYRLRRLEIRVPPLRERREDLPHLVGAFAERAAASHGKRILGISRRAFTLLLEHPWPGNIRELQEEIEHAVLLCPDGGILESQRFTIRPPASPPPPVNEASSSLRSPQTLQERIDLLERKAILDALAASGGNKTRAARALGLTRNGLNLKLKRLGLQDR